MAIEEGGLPAQGTTRVGQGPPGGRTYIYTQKHTDQENESVNHITHTLVYTLRGISQLVTVCYNTSQKV